MRSGLKSLTRWWLAAVVGVCLAAGAAGARDKAKERAQARQERARCQDQCTKANEEKVEACIKACPLPRGGNSDVFQACTQRCVKEAAFDNCSKRCEPKSEGSQRKATK
jgi:hypothetical protein